MPNTSGGKIFSMTPHAAPTAGLIANSMRTTPTRRWQGVPARLGPMMVLGPTMLSTTKVNPQG
jgi:hypothetical protein